MQERLTALKVFALGHRTAVSFAAAFIAYALCTLFYMGGALTNCTESLLTFPGDNTAGMIALFSMDSHDPWWGHSNIWSYPYGEALGQPTHITAQTLFVPFWALGKLLGPICAFNVLSFIGFVSAALVMFGFVRWLLGGKTLVALIAGFAVAFTPYLQIKTGVHISYVFEGLFVASIWLFLCFWRNPSWKKMLLLGISVASFAYTDGYFILLGGVLMASLILSTVAVDLWRQKGKLTGKLLTKVKLLAVGMGTAVALMLPVAYVQLTASTAINSLLANSRDSIARETQVYGARPLEYVLPNAMNPVTSKVFGTYYERDNHGSNPGENVLSLSLVMIGLAVYFIVRVVLALRRRQKLNLAGATFDPVFIAVVFSAVLLAALVFSFPPKLGPIPLPSFFLTEATQLWRVLARLSVIVNIALVVLASCGLVLLLERFKQYRQKILVCAIVFLLIFFEYLTFVPPRPVYGYDRVPQLYYWLHSQSKYHEIAEYPLSEFATSPFPVFYNTYQRIHGKKMLNGAVSEAKPLMARLAVRDLTEPQSVPGLRSLGIDFIVIHSSDFPGEIPGLRYVHGSPEPIIKIDNKPSKVWGYEVLPGEKADYAVAASAGFHAPVVVSPIQETQKMGHLGELSFGKLDEKGPIESRVGVAFTAQALRKSGQVISIKQQNKEIWHGTIPSGQETTVQFTADPRYGVAIEAVEPTTDATLLLPSLSVTEE